jgi:hypothetical protein
VPFGVLAFVHHADRVERVDGARAFHLDGKVARLGPAAKRRNTRQDLREVVGARGSGIRGERPLDLPRTSRGCVGEPSAPASRFLAREHANPLVGARRTVRTGESVAPLLGVGLVGRAQSVLEMRHRRRAHHSATRIGSEATPRNSTHLAWDGGAV